MFELVKTEMKWIVLTMILLVIASALNVFAAAFLQSILDTALSGNSDAFIRTFLATCAYLVFLSVLLTIAMLSQQKTKNRIIHSIRRRLMDGTFELSIESFQNSCSFS